MKMKSETKIKIMKTKSMLVIVMAMAASIVFAGNPNPKVAVINQKQPGIFKLIYEGAKEGKVKMNIFNSTGTMIYSETINSISGFSRPVNFAGLEYGEYTIEIADAVGKQSQKVNYKGQSIVKNIHIAKTSQAGKYLVAASNITNEQINVRIYDGADNLIHNEDILVDGNLGQVYNLQNVRGTPTIEVTDRSGVVKKIKF
jgi:hypothetical protein